VIRLNREFWSNLKFNLLLLLIIVRAVLIIVLLVLVILVVVVTMICKSVSILCGLLFVDKTIYLRLGILMLGLILYHRATWLESIKTSLVISKLLIPSDGLILRIVVLVDGRLKTAQSRI
jgi:hypothetical protein